MPNNHNVVSVDKVEILGEAKSRDGDTLRNEDVTKLYVIKQGNLFTSDIVTTGWLSVIAHGKDANGRTTQDKGTVQITGGITERGYGNGYFHPETMTLARSDGTLVEIKLSHSNTLKFRGTGNVATEVITFDASKNRSDIANMVQTTLNEHKEVGIAPAKQDKTQTPAKPAVSKPAVSMTGLADSVKLADVGVTSAAGDLLAGQLVSPDTKGVMGLPKEIG